MHAFTLDPLARTVIKGRPLPDRTMDATPRKIPSHELTYARLRDMVLFGRLEPGQPVTIQGLCADLDAGMTPVREAIRRLTAEAALTPQGNRRVSVPTLSRADVDQLAFARLAIEPHLVERAAARATPALILRLTALDAQVDRAIATGQVSDYLQSNHAFHFALYEASDAPVLVDMVRALWLRFGPSLRVVCARYGAGVLLDRHKEALAAMRAGDGAGLVRAMRDDICDGIEGVRGTLDA
jgi:DNA-binding GntR family transcriptional regulator